MEAAQIKQMIESNLPECEVMIQGDGRHFEAVIVSPAFAGKSMLQQHRLVYAALGDQMHSNIHALSMKTYTPDEWKKLRPSAS